MQTAAATVTAYTTGAAVDQARRDRAVTQAKRRALVTASRQKVTRTPATRTSILDVSWPIINPNMTIEALKREAASELTVLCEHNGLTPTGNPAFTLVHGTDPRLQLRQHVRHT